ncbi:MAG TPA: hypothetical protein VE057_16265 [Archangium sp.]|nr:hypothetical protein [Archangium sp.]
MQLLWIDSNVSRNPKNLRELTRLARGKPVTIVVHPQVYLERRRQMQVKCADEGKLFSSNLFDDLLGQLGVHVFEMRFDRSLASTWADLLFQRYRTHQAWETAKKGTIGGTLKEGFEVEPGRMPMTTDWLIALEVEHDPNSLIVTEDQGEEWKVLREVQPRRALSLQEAFDWLKTFPP